MIALRVRRVSGVVSTDDILPARYKHMSSDPAFLAGHVFEHRLPADQRDFRRGDCLVGDSLFGIGSSREQAVTAMMAAGIGAIVAPAFGRIFFRNAWNLALPAIELDLAEADEGAAIEIDLGRGTVRHEGTLRHFPAIPPEIQRLYRAGGLLASLSQEMRGRAAAASAEGLS